MKGNKKKKNSEEKYINEMIRYCDERKFKHFCDFVSHARQFQPEWYKILLRGGDRIIYEYIESQNKFLF
jgi:hypothetical protein